MEKQVKRIFNKKNYLLGKDSEGKNKWLLAPSWDCGWYWGFGYIETYTNNNKPEKSKGICEHTHFDSLFLNGNKCCYDLFKEYFINTPLDREEIWKLCDLMNSFYKLRDTARILNYGNSNISGSSGHLVQDKEMEDRINNVLIPELFKEIDKILSPIEE